MIIQIPCPIKKEEEREDRKKAKMLKKMEIMDLDKINIPQEEAIEQEINKILKIPTIKRSI